jgi:TolB-like protein/tetratricopeptide (TPR) repeat protein
MDRFQSARELMLALDLARSGAGGVRPALTSSVLQAPFLEDSPSIAVLPFVSLAQDQENEIFADGLSEELLNLLAKIPRLRVAARTSSFQFKGKSGDIESIGRKLNVATVLEGSVRKAGKRLRITVQLIKVNGGYHLWSQAYDREMDDIFSVQDDIAESVVRELRTALLGEKADSKAGALLRAELAAAAKGRGGSARAYEIHQQGRFFVDRNTREDMAKGIRCFQRALKLAPESALAWAGLSTAYANQISQGWLALDEGFARAREAAETALRLEPDLAEGHVALGWVRMSYDWDWAGAEVSIARALELAPGNAAVVRVAGVLAGNLGRTEEAITLDRRAVALDPLSVRTHNNLGLHCLQAGRMEEAEASLLTAVELSPRSPITRYLYGEVWLLRGDLDAADAEFGRAEDEALRLLGSALVEAAWGRSNEADAHVAELIEKHAEDSACQIACVYAFRGDRDRAFEWLERAHAQRDGGLCEAKRDPLLRNLHADPRWKAFLEKMGFGE